MPAQAALERQRLHHELVAGGRNDCPAVRGLSANDRAPTSYIWTGREAVEGPEIPGAEALMIDGLPARFAKSTTDAVPYSSETVPGATEVLWWGLTSQQQFGFGYSIVAGIRGPDVAALEAQAKALVAGIHYVPRDRHAADRSGRPRPGSPGSARD